MCLLIVSTRFERGLPLVVAANRDERYDRPASAIAVRAELPRVLAGRDEEAGGTWLAVNEHGLVAGLTNQPSPLGHDPTKRTRGELPFFLARHERAEDAVEAFATEVDESRYNPCSLLVGDRTALFSLELSHEQPLEVRALEPGRYVLENRPLGSASAKASLVEKRLGQLAPELDASTLRRGLVEILADHTVPEPLAHQSVEPCRPGPSPACIHTAHHGTRSSSIVVVPDEPLRLPTVLVADGAPCTSAFRDVSELWQ